MQGLFVHVGTTAPANLDFGARNLAGWFVSGTPGKLGNLQGADFRQANIKGLGLSNVDLTGARFPAHAGSLLYIASGVTCPDGRKATLINSYTNSCRLPK